MENFFTTIGIEVEGHLTNQMGQPISIEQAPELNKAIITYLKEHGLPEYSLEPQDSILEFKTNPHHSRTDLFKELELIYDLDKLFKKYGCQILFQGVNPNTTDPTNLQSRTELPFADLIAYAGVHINIAIPEPYLTDFFQILDSIQQWCIPYIALMQSSPVVANKNSHLLSSRHAMFQAALGCHFNFFPKTLMSWDKILAYQSLLLQTDENYAVHSWCNLLQHCVRPKKTDQHSIIELRYFDTSNIDALKTTIDLVAQTAQHLVYNHKNLSALCLYQDQIFLETTLHQVIQLGRKAQIVLDFDQILPMEAWSKNHLSRLDSKLHKDFMQALAKPSQAELVLEDFLAPLPLKKNI